MNEGYPREWRCGEYVISDDPARFDVDAMHDFLALEGYWARGRSRETTAVAVANSVVLGVYGPDGSMVGGARIVTDQATFGWLTDLYVLSEHRGQGLGTAVAAAASGHPAMATVKRLMLMTGDAHELYRPLGFTELSQPERWMELCPTAPSDRAAGPAGVSGSRAVDGAAASVGDAAAPPYAGAEARVEPESSESRPHVSWQGDGLPDPRTAQVSRIAERLLEIVSTEGPITADRAYRLYIRGAGSSKVTQRARAPMEQALGRLTLRGQVETDELDNAGSPQQVLRLVGTPAVVLRELGERSLYEVPLNEITQMMRSMRAEITGAGGGQPAHAVASVIQQAALRRASPDRLMRAVLDSYGLIRMTQAAEQYLTAALALLESDD